MRCYGYAPAHLAAAIDEEENITLSWIRRCRGEGAWQDAVDVPLNEETESYEIDIMDGEEVVRTLTSSSPIVVYSAEDQTEDFGTTQSTISFRVYQMSAQVGRGYGAEATLDVPIPEDLTADVLALSPDALFDNSTAANLYQDEARSTLVVAVNDPCASSTDLTTNARHMQIFTGLNGERPLWTGNALRFDGSDDGMIVDWGAGNQITQPITHVISFKMVSVNATTEIIFSAVSSSFVNVLYANGSPADEFTSHENDIACYTENGWIFAAPFKWLDVVNEEDDTRYVFDGTGWVPFGLLMKDTGEYLRVEHLQEDITGLSGASVNSTIDIPDRSLVIAVNVRVTTAITGSTSFDVGVSGDTSRYGNGIGVTLDSTSIGMSQYPYAYYADTGLILTAQGGSFTAGEVRLSVQYLKPRGPWSW